jgi:transposase-like protein
MSKRTRRRYTPEQKAALVRQHVVDKKPVSEICSAAQLQPSVFYKWERDLLEAAPSVFAGHRAPSREQELEAKIAALEVKLARKDAIIAEVSEEYVKLKKSTWGTLTGAWVPPDTRDGIVDFVREFSARTELAVTRVVGWLGIARGKFFDWRQRYGKANEHNALVPRDHWLEEAERQAIVE